MYAVIKTGGKQYKVAAGETLRVERLTADVGADVTQDKVRIFKMRRRKHYQKRQGHRQNFTEIRISAVNAA